MHVSRLFLAGLTVSEARVQLGLDEDSNAVTGQIEQKLSVLEHTEGEYFRNAIATR
jgi:hypothetical protein